MVIWATIWEDRDFQDEAGNSKWSISSEFGLCDESHSAGLMDDGRSNSTGLKQNSIFSSFRLNRSSLMFVFSVLGSTCFEETWAIAAKASRWALTKKLFTFCMMMIPIQRWSRWCYQFSSFLTLKNTFYKSFEKLLSVLLTLPIAFQCQPEAGGRSSSE